MKGASRLRELIRDTAPVIVPGAHDLLTTKLVARQGFRAVYVGSYGCAAKSLGTSGPVSPNHERIARTSAPHG